MPFAVVWIDTEIIILSEVSQKKKQIPYDITYIWNIKYDINELIYKTEKAHRYAEQTCDCQGRGEWGRKDRNLGLVDADSYRMDKQQGPATYHRKLYSISCEKP